MATHEQNIENLRSAVYGEQVRGSMIELFEEDYKLVKNGLGVGTDITSPSSSTEGYSDGNVYLNIETQDIWKLENEAWAKKGNMKGIQSIEYEPTTGDGDYNILTITLTDGSAPIVCRIKNGETGNGVESVAVISTVGNVKTYRMTFTDGTHYDWDVQEGGHVIADEEGTVMAQQPTVQFIGANVENDTTTDPSNPVTKVTIPQGGHRIASTLPNGSIMPVGVKREVLEFEGFNVEDNPDPDHLSTVVHGQIKVSPNEQHWNNLSDEEKNDRNTYWFRPWADTVAFATDKTPVGTVLSVATGKTGDGISGITTPTGTFPTTDYLVCDGQSVPVATYPALVTYFQTRYGSAYYFGGSGASFSLPNWSSDFPSNGVLVMKARESSNAMSITEIDDTSVSEDKTWSSQKVNSENTALKAMVTDDYIFSPSKAYVAGDWLIHNNILYEVLVACTGVTPPNATYYKVKTLHDLQDDITARLNIKLKIQTVLGDVTTAGGYVTLNFIRPSDATYVYGAPITIVTASNSVNSLTAVVPLDDLHVRVVSATVQTVNVTRLYIYT